MKDAAKVVIGEFDAGGYCNLRLEKLPESGRYDRYTFVGGVLAFHPYAYNLVPRLIARCTVGGRIEIS